MQNLAYTSVNQALHFFACSFAFSLALHVLFHFFRLLETFARQQKKQKQIVPAELALTACHDATARQCDRALGRNHER